MTNASTECKKLTKNYRLTKQHQKHTRSNFKIADIQNKQVHNILKQQ